MISVETSHRIQNFDDNIYSLSKEHALYVNGNGVNHTIDDLLAVADNIGFNHFKIKK